MKTRREFLALAGVLPFTLPAALTAASVVTAETEQTETEQAETEQAETYRYAADLSIRMTFNTAEDMQAVTNRAYQATLVRNIPPDFLKMLHCPEGAYLLVYNALFKETTDEDPLGWGLRQYTGNLDVVIFAGNKETIERYKRYDHSFSDVEIYHWSFSDTLKLPKPITIEKIIQIVRQHTVKDGDVFKCPYAEKFAQVLAEENAIIRA